MLRSLILTLVLVSSVFGQTKVREGAQTQGALPTTQGGVAAGGTTGQVLKKNSNADFDLVWGTVSSGASTFLDLTDTPSSYTGQGLKGVRVNVAENALEFYTVSTPTPAALTKTDDTNVTLTLGGTPATALLQATSLTLGWTGTLAISRGGTGAATSGAHTFFANNTGSSGAPSFTSFVAKTDYWDTTDFIGTEGVSTHGLVPAVPGAVPPCVRFLSETSPFWQCAGGGSSGGAPDNAAYLTAKAESGLSAEVNLGALATGLLKGTVSGSVSTISSITDNSSNWDTAFTDRLKWDGGSVGLVATTGRTSLGATTVGSNIFTLTNPSAITWARINADNTVTTRTASETRTDLSLVVGTNVQAWDADLDTWATLTPTTVGQNLVKLANPSAISFVKIAADNTVSTRTPTQVVSDLALTIGTNTQAWDADLDTWATLTPSANFQTMVPHTFSQMRTDLGLVIGTNVQAWDTQLDSLAGLSYTGNTLKVIRVNAGETGFELVTPSSGGVTSVATTSPITGGTITTTGTIALDVSVDHAFTTSQTATVTDASNNVADVLVLRHNAAGAGGTSKGTGVVLRAKDSTTASQDQAEMSSYWSDATHAAPISNLQWQVANGAGLATQMVLTGAGGLSVGQNAGMANGVINAGVGFQIAASVVGSGKLLQGNGTNFVISTAAWPTTASTANKVVQSNGSDFISQFLKGTTTNNNAAAGEVGEEVESLIAVGSAVSLTTATAANITSISLTAGDWNVSGNVNFTETTSTVTARSAGIGTTSATLPTDGSEAYCGVQSTVTSETNSITLPTKRVSLSGTTTTYLVAKATFSAGTCAGFGAIVARRVR